MTVRTLCIMNKFKRHIDIVFVFLASELCAFLIFYVFIVQPGDTPSIVDAVFTLIHLFVGFVACFVWFTVYKERDEERIPLLP